MQNKVSNNKIILINLPKPKYDSPMRYTLNIVSEKMTIDDDSTINI